MKCRAFKPIAGTRMAWIPCAHKAERGQKYCRSHGVAIMGICLGALVYGDPVDEVEPLRWKLKSELRPKPKPANPQTKPPAPIDLQLTGTVSSETNCGGKHGKS
jgi:hypothetical protein